MAVVGSMVIFRPRNNLAARMGVTSCAALVTKLSAGCASLMVYPKGEAPFQVYGVRLDAALSVEHSFADTVGGGVAATPSMPTGLVGYWNTDTYNSAAKVITNEVDGTTPTPNLLRLPRRMFSSSATWATSSATVSDNFAVGPDGLTEASRVVGTGTFWGIKKNINLAAGTYTLAVNVKSNTGASQTFRMWLGNGTLSGNLTATTSWQRFTLTSAVTSGAQDVYPVFSDGTNLDDILICNAELYAGSSDLGPIAPKGHLYLGKSAASAPAVTSGLIAAGGEGGIIQFGSDQTLSTFTAFAVASKTTSAGSYQGIFSKIDAFTAFGPSFEVSDVVVQFFGGQQNSSKNAKIRNPLGMGLLMFTARYDGTNLDTFINDVLVDRQTLTLSAQTVREMWMGVVNGAFTADYNIYSSGLANRAWTNTEIANALSAQKARAATSGLTLNLLTRYHVAEGDSRVAGVGSWPNLFNANASPKTVGTVQGVSGSVLADMVTRASATDALLKSGATNILSVMIGANDLSSYPGASDAAAGAAYAAALASYCDARRAAGWKVIVTTLIPVTVANRTNHNARRPYVNSAIAGWVGVHCDGIADFAADPTMGPDAAASNTTYYPDGLHPSDAGNAILETIFRPVANTL